jgi:hypothetical protein
LVATALELFGIETLVVDPIARADDNRRRRDSGVGQCVAKSNEAVTAFKKTASYSPIAWSGRNSCSGVDTVVARTT